MESGGEIDETHLSDGIRFEWNARKAAANLRKHGISFAEGATVFADEDGLIIGDPDHSDDELRFLLVGVSRLRRVLVVVSVERGERFRIISARKADSKERAHYEEGRQDRRQ